MGKQTATPSNLTIGPWPVRDGQATLYLKGTGGDRDWDGATAQVEFKAPWSDPADDWIADSRFTYTEDTVDTIEVGDVASVRIVFSGGGASLEVDGGVSN